MASSSLWVSVSISGITSCRSGTFDWDILSVALRNGWWSMSNYNIYHEWAQTFRIGSSWWSSSHSCSINLSFLRANFACMLWCAIPTSKSNAGRRYSTLSTIFATEFHWVGTARLIFLGGILALPQHSLRSAWRSNEKEICFASFVI